jgi:glycosyltransferase involved in cell wall biosynthesis
METNVCICIPAYNSEKTIEKTLNSLLNQTHENLRINVVDNVSTDNTANIARSMDDTRITVYTNTIHYPMGEHNWNRCFAYMPTGGYSGIFHADDIYTPKMIEKQVDILNTHPDTMAVFTGMKFIGDTDNTIKIPPLPEPYTHNKELNKYDVLVSTLRYGNQLATPSALCASNIYKGASPFRYEAFGYSSDLDMWLRIAHYFKIFVINEPLIHYRVSKNKGSNLIHNSRTSEEMFFRTMDYHIVGINGIPQDAIDIYELRRIVDKVKCIKNSVVKMGDRFPHVLYQGLLKKMV